MAERGMPELVCGREPLHRQLTLGGHDDPRCRIVEESPEETIQGPEHHGNVPVHQHLEHIDPAFPLVGAGLGVELLMQPIRLGDGAQDGVANSRHDSALLCLLPRSQEIRKPPEFRPIVSREFGGLSRKMRDISLERDLFGLLPREVTDVRL